MSCGVEKIENRPRLKFNNFFYISNFEYCSVMILISKCTSWQKFWKFLFSVPCCRDTSLTSVSWFWAISSRNQFVWSTTDSALLLFISSEVYSQGSGFLIDLDRIRGLPGAPDYEITEFRVHFDPRGSNLDLGPVQCEVPLHVSLLHLFFYSTTPHWTGNYRFFLTAFSPKFFSNSRKLNFSRSFKKLLGSSFCSV